MQSRREQLYVSTILTYLKSFAQQAGIKDFSETKFGKYSTTDDYLQPFIQKGRNFSDGISNGASTNEAHGILLSIFNEISVPNREPFKKSTKAFPLKPLTAENDSCFVEPVENLTLNRDIRYEELWKGLESEFFKLENCGQLYGDGFLSILKKYTWCVPNDYSKGAVTSLYDAMKTSAAFAVCLYDQCNGECDDNTKPFILLGCDVSGIQSFIYNIASRKAAMSLKGRSFYIQLLVDSVIKRICEHEDIKAFSAQVVYSSGGKFYMLLPNISQVKVALSDMKCEIERELFKDHNGQLMLNIAYIPFGFSDNVSTSSSCLNFSNKKDVEIGLLWKELADKLAECKNQKFKSIINIELFRAHKVAANVRVCEVTGIESSNCEPIDTREREKTYVLPIVKKEVELGFKLKDSKFIASWIGHHEKLLPDITIFGVNFKLLPSVNLSLMEKGPRVSLITINDTDCTKYNSKLVDAGFKFYGGNRQALNIFGENKTFEELADNQYFGVLRMDVDNLGAIFIKGLPNSTKNFAAYSTLSFLFDYFFCGCLNHIRESELFINDVNILYAGGDDVFALGRWDKLILFAEAIRKQFARFVGNDCITISGGIAIVGEKFPIAKAAQISGESEEHAKKDNNGKKDAFNMFGQTVCWGDEFDFVKSKSREFIDLITNYKMPKGILHRIMLLCDVMNNGDMSYVWHTIYFLTRFSEGKKQEVKDFCHNLQKILCDKRTYQLTALAARWAEYELKFNKLNIK